jgi:serine/threonine protein kinase
MELCHGCLLDFTLAQPCSHLTDVQASVWAAQLLEGLQDMHAVGILHRDIKPDNLLLTSDGSLRISDFGWAARLEDRPSCLAGTFHYMAPEVLRQREVHTEAVDAWSAGMTFVELTTGRTMLNVDEHTGLSQTAWLIALEIRTMKFLDEIAFLCPPAEQHRPVHLSTFCWSLLRSLVEPELARRSSVSAALCHPWLRREKTSVLDCSTSVGESFLEDSSLLNDSGLALLEFMPSPGMSLITTSPAVLRRPASPCPPERRVSDLTETLATTVVRSVSCDEGLFAAMGAKRQRHKLKTIVTVSTASLPLEASSAPGSGSVPPQANSLGDLRLCSARVNLEGKQENPFAQHSERQLGTASRRTIPVCTSRTTLREPLFTMAPRANPIASHGGLPCTPLSVKRELPCPGPQRALRGSTGPPPSPASAPRTTLTIGSGHQFYGARPGQNVRWTLPAPGCNERKVPAATGNNCARRALRVARGATSGPMYGQRHHVSSTHRLCGVPRA